MEKQLIWKDEHSILQHKKRLEGSTAELNAILNDLYSMGLTAKTEKDALQFFDEPARYLVEGLGLKDNNLARMLADEKILTLLEDSKPLQIVERVKKLKPEKGWNIYQDVIKAQVVKFEKGGFILKDHAFEKIEDEFSIYAQTPKELEVYNDIKQLQDIIFKLHKTLKLETEDVHNTLLPLTAPFSYIDDNGSFKISVDRWKLIAEKLKRKS